MLLSNKRGEERNYGVLIAAIVAIVAIVGLIILFNKGGASGAAVDASDFGGVQDAVQASLDAGRRCGQCAAQWGQTGQWDSSLCPAVPQSIVSGYSDSQVMQECCKAESLVIGWKRGYEYCAGAGSEASYNYAHGTGGYGYD